MNREFKQASTPSSHWRAEGASDPHAGHYDGERAALAMGKLTDDELANGAFMNYDQPLNVHGIVAGTHSSPIAWMTAVKDRIRWLSRSLEGAAAERDALAAELKALREQEPIGYISPKTSHWLAAHKASSSSYGAIRIHCSETDSQTVPLYAHPVPARELTDETIQRHWDEACKDTRKPLAGADTSVLPAPSNAT